jgi:hypothetical protein
MSRIPFEKQRLPTDAIERIEADMAQGQAIAGDELLRAIGSEGHELSPRLREILRKTSIAAVSRRGRPKRPKGSEDFALKEVDELYPALLRKHKDEAVKRKAARAKSDLVPSELAYREIAEIMQKDFPNLDWRALANKHSEWKNGQAHPAENEVDSEDFDAAIERHFPSPEGS